MAMSGSLFTPTPLGHVDNLEEVPNWLERQRVETDGSSATLCHIVSTLSSVRIFQWAPLPGRSFTEPSTTK
ncbi:hypothetical protein TNCV_350621 [Trichonephila clavipes]|nr:hypothetical protein TNCV_350621 [Trichonephila clavipes]